MTSDNSWHEEKQSAWIYRKLTEAEPDVRLKKLFTALAEAAESQASHWRSRVSGSEPSFRPTLRARTVIALLRFFEPRQLRGVLAAMKVRGLSAYDVLTHAVPTSVNEIGRRHRGVGGGKLRAGVFGVSDGLVSNTSLLMGIAGASAEPRWLVASGIAGLLAGALSMAAGEYISVRSQREMFEYQIGLERDELAEYPDAEAEELALIYEARGMPLEQAREFSRGLMSNPEQALDVLAREELGLNPEDLGSPWGAAIVSFITFALGAVLPVLPFAFSSAVTSAVIAAAALAAAGLLAVGATLSLFTGRSAAWGALRMLGIGAGAGLITFCIGRWVGGVL